MDTNVAVSTTFQDKVAEKLKESIADLLSEDELRLLVKKGVDQYLFEPHTDKYGDRSVSVAEKFIREKAASELQAELKVQLAAWFVDNEDQVRSIVQEAITQGAGQLIVKGLTTALSSHIDLLFCNFTNSVRTGNF